MKMVTRLFVFSMLCCLVTACGGGGGGDSTPDPVKPAANIAPDANADNASLWVNDTVTIAVLSNDTDSNGDSLTISEVSTPANGSAVISGTNISYTPSQNFIGSDNFSYTISDGNGGSASSTISVIVNNKSPDAVNDAVTVMQSNSVELDLLANDSSQGQLLLTVVSMTTPNHGQLSTEQGIVSYVPQLGYVGQDSFGYVVRDSLGDESTATVSIEVQNQLPVATDDSAETQQNQTVIISAIDNDADAAGETLTISGNSIPDSGQVTIENNALAYTPQLGFSGQDSFTYTLVDSYGASSEATVLVDVINQLPTIVDDNVNVLSGYTIIIDALANDSDAEGDSLTIQSLSTPEQGSADIVDNKINFTAPADYEGTILVGYTVVDSFDGSGSGFVSFEVSNGVIVNGVIADLAQAGIEVTLTAGDYSTTVTTDATGAFSARISLESLAELAVASVSYPDQNYTLFAHYGLTSDLLAQADDAGEVDVPLISHFTTAEYELLNVTNQALITTAQMLEEKRMELDYDYVINLAAAANIITTDNGLNLPNGYSSINDLMQSPFQVSKELGKWRVNNNQDYLLAFESLFDNEQLTWSPDELNQGEHFLYRSDKTAFFLETGYFIFSGSGQGYLGTNLALTWQLSDVLLNIDMVDISKVTFDRYDETSSVNSFSFGIENIQLKKVLKNDSFTVFYEKQTGCTNTTKDEQDNDICEQNSSTYTHYQSRRLIKPESSTIAAGEYHFSTVDYADDNTETGRDTDFDTVAGTFTFNNDGTFGEYTDSYNEERAGTWTVNQDGFELNYDSGINIFYRKVTEYQGIPFYEYTVVENNQTIWVANTYLVTKESISTFNSVAEFSMAEFALHDPDLDTGFKIPYSADNTGIQQNYWEGEWTDSSISIFSWSFSNFLYKADYFAFVDSWDFVTYCDTNDDNCEKWRYREFEVIGNQGDWYIIKNNQEFLPNSLGLQESRSGYIGLYQYNAL